MCFKLSTIEKLLKPCGFKCRDIRELVLQQCQSEQKTLQNILKSVYFKDTPDIPGQKRAILTHTENRKIDIYVLTQKNRNLLFFKLSKNCHEINFGKIRVIFMTYLKCFCDQCLEINLFRWSNESKIWRIYVFDSYIIPVYTTYRGIPLLSQLALKALIKPIKCCEPSIARQNHIWLGDGIDPTTSLCRLGDTNSFLKQLHEGNLYYKGKFLRKRQYNIRCVNWEDLGVETPSFLLLGLKNNELHLFSRLGDIICVQYFPPSLEKWIKKLSIGERDLIFISKTYTNYKSVIFTEALLSKH